MLIFDTGHLGDFVDEIKNTRWNADNFVIHNFEKLSEEQGTLIDKIDRVGLFGLILVGLFLEEMFHVNVVVFAEELEESEDSADSFLVVDFSHELKLIKRFIPELFGNGVFFGVEVIIGILNLVGERPFFAALFDFSDFDEKSSDNLDKFSQTDEH